MVRIENKAQKHGSNWKWSTKTWFELKTKYKNMVQIENKAQKDGSNWKQNTKYGLNWKQSK